MLIIRIKDYTPIEFRFKGKVTRADFVKKIKTCFAHYLENCLLQSFYISHAVGLGENTRPGLNGSPL